MALKTLRSKFAARKDARKRALRRFKKTNLRGYAEAAAKDGRAMRLLRKLIVKAKNAKPKGLAVVKVHSTALGRPHWGGGADVMGQFVTPLMHRHGLYPGSGKRTPAHNAAIGGSPTSDHLTTRRETFARDYPTFSGHDAAAALARAFGIHGWSENSYTTYDVRIDGHTFRIQILWGAAIQHGDHVHVGIEIVS